MNPLYQKGDRVLCYPSLEHWMEGWEVKAVILDITYENNIMWECWVKYVRKGKEETRRIGGGSSDWLLKKVSKR